MNVTVKKQKSGTALSLLRFLVVAAAGAGGWLGHERVVAEAAREADQAEVEASVGPQSPWPVDLIVAETAWTGPIRTTLDLATGPSQRVDTDPATGRTKSAWSTSDGEVTIEFEADDDEVFVDRHDGLGYVAESADSASGFLRVIYAGYQPTLDEVFPSTTWAFTELVSNERGPSAASPTRRLTLRIDVQGFIAAKPAQAAQWRRSVYGTDIADTSEYVVELDVEGQIIRLFDGGNDAAFEQLDVPPTFVSPLTP